MVLVQMIHQMSQTLRAEVFRQLAVELTVLALEGSSGCSLQGLPEVKGLMSCVMALVQIVCWTATINVLIQFLVTDVWTTLQIVRS